MTEYLDHFLKKWHLSDPMQLADTPTSKIYTVIYNSEKAILKLLTPVGQKDEKNGAIALQSFNGAGSVKLFQHNDKAQLLEFAEGDDLTVLVERGEDEKATNITAVVLNKLHKSDNGLPPKELMTLKDRFNALYIKAGQEKNSERQSIYSHAAKVAQSLLTDQKDIRILHGDIHHENIRYSSKRGWLAIDPKGLVGERTYDAANTLCNPWNMKYLVEDEKRLLKNATLLAENMKVNRARLLRFTFAHACLSACWCLEDGDDPTHALNMAAIIEPHITSG